uniref:Corin, serine peptidase n=1 Tax=Poecilia latipinna TaxID=48699 RepID=A0A3B3U546_9TELE
MDQGACPKKLGSSNQMRLLLLYILLPTVSLLGALLLGLALTGRGHTWGEGSEPQHRVRTAAPGQNHRGRGGVMSCSVYLTLEPVGWAVLAGLDLNPVVLCCRFFSYLSRLSCYRHILLFGCSLALPECLEADGTNSRKVVLPCASFCEAAREGCEPVLQMFNASWPDFLRCSQFSQNASSPSSPMATSAVCGGKDNFLCATGICVPQKLVCNGYNDCDDWSDETHCECPDEEFRCNTGRCLSPVLVCDGYDDCGDLSDELNCACRSQGLLECRNGQCVPSAFRCDGEDDCKDGSDEEHCSREQSETSLHSTHLCSSFLSRCEPITLELCMNLPYNQTSFPNFLGHLSQRESSVSWESSLFPALVQTGCYQYLMFYACTLLVPKCDPLSLQKVPPCRSLCRIAKEKCESVLGIVGLQWPEDSDCSQFPEDGGNSTCLLPEDGVDECSPSHFKCRSGRCVLATKRCDGHLDCDDHSDEDNCGCSERALWECPGSTLCIKPSMICDGFPDCPLQVDEANCSVCRDNELACNNHQCVHRTLWCDGRRHCSDSSDEWNCGTVTSAVCVQPSVLTGRSGSWGAGCPGVGRGPGSARCRAVRADTCAAASSSPGAGL